MYHLIDGEVKIRDYFNRNAITFDAIYSGKKNVLLRMVDRYLRPDMYMRFHLTMQYSGDVKGKEILDIGCGSGRYAVVFAQRGAKKVVGIDLAENMVKQAEKIAQTLGVEDICEFKIGNFFEYQFHQKFDIIIAIGVFDYINDPSSLLRRMVSLARYRVLTTFPSYSIIRGPLRKMCYKMKGCPVYLYDRKTIRELFGQINVKSYKIIKIKGWGMDFFVYADV